MIRLRRVHRTGRSLAVTIPTSIAGPLGISRGDFVLLGLDRGRLTVRRIDEGELDKYLKGGADGVGPDRGDR